MKLPKLMKKKKMIAVVAIICIVAIGAGAYIVYAKNKASAQQQVPQFQTMVLGKQDVTKEIGLSGTLDSAHSESVSSTLEGVKIKEISVQVGDHVKAGDVLFRLDSTDIENKLKAAQSALNSEKEKNAAEIKSGQRNFADAQTTQTVTEGRSVQNITDATNDYNAAVEAKNNADGEYNNAVSDRKEKEKELRKATEKVKDAKNEEKKKNNALETAKAGGDAAAIAAAQQEYDAAAAARQSAEEKAASIEADTAKSKETEALRETAVKEAEANVNTTHDTMQKFGQEKEDTTRSNQKTVEDQKDSLEAAKRSASEQSATAQEVDTYQKQLEECTVKAASDGVVTTINVKVGDTYTNGVMATVQDEKNYIVTAMVDQYDISDITKDMKAIIQTETTGEEKMDGIVSFVSPVPGSGSSSDSKEGSGSGTSNNYEVKITVNKPSERLRIGMTAKVKLVQDEVKNVFAVPGDCITEGEDGSCSIQILKDGAPKTITVEKGLETDYYTQISADELTDGMEVIIPDAVDASQDMEMGGAVSIY